MNTQIREQDEECKCDEEYLCPRCFEEEKSYWQAQYALGPRLYSSYYGEKCQVCELGCINEKDVCNRCQARVGAF